MTRGRRLAPDAALDAALDQGPARDGRATARRRCVPLAEESVMHAASPHEEHGVTVGSRPLARPEVDVYVFGDGSCLLFDPRANDGHVLDALAALTWDYCDGERSVGEIAGEITALLPQYSAASVEEHVLDLVADFTRRGLLLCPPGDRGPEDRQPDVRPSR